MDLRFEKTTCKYLQRIICEVQNQEQSQEIKLSEGMPDIGRVIGSWGQPVVRGKEWRNDSIVLSGGIIAWILYQPEDNSQNRIINCWIPFQMKWNMSEIVIDGKIIADCRIRFIDTRSVSPRKMILRAGIAALGQVYIEKETDIPCASEAVSGVETLKKMHSFIIPVESDEKSFQIDEQLSESASAEGLGEVVYYTVFPEILDQKVVGNKLAFRGNTNLHIVTINESGTLSEHDYSLAFSQFAELDKSYSTDACARIKMSVTGIEVDHDEYETQQIRCGLTAQYLIEEKMVVETIDDAYSTMHEVNTENVIIELPVRLEEIQENLSIEQTVPSGVSGIADVSFQIDYPICRYQDESIECTIPGTCQILYFDEESMLQSVNVHWEEKQTMRVSDAAVDYVNPHHPGGYQIITSGSTMSVRSDIQLGVFLTKNQSMNILAGLEVGEVSIPEDQKPSLILKRMSEETLWNVAKASGSTVDAILRANSLETEPSHGKMLLIPII